MVSAGIVSDEHANVVGTNEQTLSVLAISKRCNVETTEFHIPYIFSNARIRPQRLSTRPPTILAGES
jgi:hypothetical protein